MGLGPVAPFDASIAVMLLAGVVILATWSENYGKTTHRSIGAQFNEALLAIYAGVCVRVCVCVSCVCVCVHVVCVCRVCLCFFYVCVSVGVHARVSHVSVLVHKYWSAAAAQLHTDRCPCQ